MEHLRVGCKGRKQRSSRGQWTGLTNSKTNKMILTIHNNDAMIN